MNKPKYPRGSKIDMRLYDGGSEEFHVWAGGVSVPTEMFSFLKNRNIKTVFALVAFLRAFPSEFSCLGMDLKTTKKFTAEVLWKLRMYFPIGTFVKRKNKQVTLMPLKGSN